MVAHINTRPTDLPSYGSPHWAALADDDPRKLAAAVIAAECWATDLDDLPDRLRRELAAARQADENRWTELFEDARQTAHAAASPAAFALRAHYAKTQAQRITDARRRRPGDCPGQQINPDDPDTAVQDGEAA
jgi:hypothetical protein